MKLLIIEDSQQLADSMISYLQQEGYRCEVVTDVNGALEKVLFHDYDCILLDLMLPDGSGLKVLEELKANAKMDGVIIISAKDSLDDRIQGLRIGADDYLAKPFHLAELGARIQAVIRRKNFLGSNKIIFKELSIDVQAQLITVNGAVIFLTRKEYDLLLFLISSKGRVVSKNAIAEHLSGDMSDLLDNHGFVYAHIKNLKKKLSESGCIDYINTVYGFGYQWKA